MKGRFTGKSAIGNRRRLRPLILHHWKWAVAFTFHNQCAATISVFGANHVRPDQQHPAPGWSVDELFLCGVRYCLWIESFTLVANANLQLGIVDAAIYMNHFGLIELVAVLDGVCESFFQYNRTANVSRIDQVKLCIC